MEILDITEAYPTTTEYDYGDSTPCQKTAVRAFGAGFLPPPVLSCVHHWSGRQCPGDSGAHAA